MKERMTMRIMSLLPVFVLTLMLASVEGTAEIIPDPDFDGDGLTITKIGAGKDEAKAIGVQDDGKIVVAGQTGDPDTSDIAVMRYLPDGGVDHDFVFSAGHVIGAGLGSDGVRALLFDTAGRIVLGGFVTDNGTRFGALVRLLEDGGLDYQFGDQGVVLFSSEGDETDFFDISIGSDERITAAGSTGSDADILPLFVRFNEDGSVDDTYATDGAQVLSELKGAIHGMAVYGDDSVAGGGYALDEQDEKQLLLIRMKTDGSLDESFGDQGQLVVNDVNNRIIVHDVGLLPDNRIVAVGEMVDDEDRSSIMISRFLTDGSPDPNLSDSGILNYDIGEESGAYGVSILDNGVILATGYRRDENDKDTIILRLESSGNNITEIHLPESVEIPTDLDPEITEILKISALQVEEGSFNPDSLDPGSKTDQDADLITTELDGSDEESLAVEALADGTIYTAGSSGTEDDTALMVAKYTDDDDEDSSESVDKPDPQTSDFYRIETLPITEITRVGAMTGGRITDLNFDSEQCLLTCEEYCSSDTDDDEDSETTESTDTETDLTCLEACNQGCTAPAIEKRGVVFSINPGPEYDGDVSSDDTDDGDSGTNTTITDDDTDPDNPLGSESLLNLNDYIVEGGQTDDGDGDGEYTSEIADVNPQTIYYVRAYALLSDGTVIYGNETHFRTNDSCFIATAAFGSIDGYGVQVLRQFRDAYLKTTGLGTTAVGWYYKISPPIADFIAQSVMLRVLVIILLLPVVVWAWMLLHFELVIAGVVVATLIKYCTKRTLNTETA